MPATTWVGFSRVNDRYECIVDRHREALRRDMVLGTQWSERGGTVRRGWSTHIGLLLQSEDFEHHHKCNGKTPWRVWWWIGELRERVMSLSQFLAWGHRIEWASFINPVDMQREGANRGNNWFGPFLFEEQRLLTTRQKRRLQRKLWVKSFLYGNDLVIVASTVDR